MVLRVLRRPMRVSAQVANAVVRQGRQGLLQRHMSVLLVVAAAICGAPPAAFAGAKLPLCHTGRVTLLPFGEHVQTLRRMSRYSREDIDGLVAQQRKGGAGFFGSQIIVQPEPAASAAFDLRTTHGLNDAKRYRNLTRWTCERAGYPIVTFVGLRVRAIAGRTILVSRAPGAVNVLSLKRLDADLEKRIKVRVQGTRMLLCRDIAKGCVRTIFYERG